MRIVLLGPPGAGKGTQAALIAERFAIPHISTGEMMRAAVAAKSSVGLRIGEYLARGELVPDALTIELLSERLERDDCRNGFLLDGFPRTVDQAKALTDRLAQLGKPLTHVVEVVVPHELLLERIRKRAGEGRNDDSEEVFARRLEVYKAQTAPVSRYYEQMGGLRTVDGVGTIDEVKARISEAIERKAGCCCHL